MAARKARRAVQQAANEEIVSSDSDLESVVLEDSELSIIKIKGTEDEKWSDVEDDRKCLH